MRRKRLPKSIRKFIRFEKARIRRQFFDSKERGNLIGQLYQNLALQSKEKESSETKKPQKKVKTSVGKK